MTDTNKQALEDLNAIVEILKGYGDYDLGVSIAGYLIKAQAALQPKLSVDVEALVTNYTERFEKYKGNTGDYYPNNHAAMIGCMEKALHSQGHINQGTIGAEQVQSSSNCTCDQGWRDIESAPKDGSMILVYKDKKVSIVKWIDGDSICRGAFFKTNSVFYHEEHLTHWMPLPQPPKSEDK